MIQIKVKLNLHKKEGLVIYEKYKLIFILRKMYCLSCCQNFITF